jgi:hypothetical protein
MRFTPAQDNQRCKPGVISMIRYLHLSNNIFNQTWFERLKSRQSGSRSPVGPPNPDGRFIALDT